MVKKDNYFIKTERSFSFIRTYGWLFTFMVAVVGQWVPLLGLLVLPIMLSLTVMSFFRGRYWCGNFCPHGSLYDKILMPLSRNVDIPRIFTYRAAAIAFFVFFLFNLGRRILAVSALWGETPFWERLGYVFVMTYLVVAIVGGLFAVLFTPRTWCRICPMGTIQTASYALGRYLGVARKFDKKVSIKNKDMCHTCGKCARVCPIQLNPYLEFSGKNQYDDEQCIRCSTCVNNCPAQILNLETEDNALAISAATGSMGYENRRALKAIVMKITDLTDDVKEFTFKLDEPPRISFQPGQFILVKIQEVPKMYRAYSVAWYDETESLLKVAVKKAPNGYGTEIMFNEISVGDNIELEGPLGAELIVDKDAEKLVFVAGGIGITPFLPMVEDLTAGEGKKPEVTLIYGANKTDELVYDEYFRETAAKNSNFSYIPVVAFDDSWKGAKGFVTDVMKDMELADKKIYMCGPPPMVKAVNRLLDEKGVNRNNVFAETAA